ncbi:twin-arginine translocation signal domain-containing protein [Ensifer soli]|uniref:twin-arginine translocation signal domain-containing protein n=1 Tax=Ciceribacter sp. sgz301302 TaxID=3342379 RepID=UPI0035B8EA34
MTSGKTDTPNVNMSRRDFMGTVMSMAAVGAAASVMPGLTQQAWAAGEAVKGYGVTTSQLKDWSIMTKTIGVDIDYTPTNADIGVFMRDVMSNNLGATHDIFIFDGGSEDLLGPEGYYAEIVEDHPELTNWARTDDSWKRAAYLRAGDKQYGVPVIGNGDAFGYFPAAIDANPNGMDEIPWTTFFEGESVKGKVAIDRSWLQSFSETANFLKHHGRITVDDPADLPPEAAKAVADYLVERKKAGQFRTIFTAFEEQVQLLSNKEVDMINCWEPATKEANNALGPNSVIYAFTVEGYYLWGHGANVAAAAMDRGNVDNIYKVLNYFLSGEYRAYQAKERGYAGPNMDLGVQYAIDNGWSKEDIDNLKWTEEKVKRKFQKPFYCKVVPDNAAVMEEEWQRFLNA